MSAPRALPPFLEKAIFFGLGVTTTLNYFYPWGRSS